METSYVPLYYSIAVYPHILWNKIPSWQEAQADVIKNPAESLWAALNKFLWLLIETFEYKDQKIGLL